MSSMSAAPSAPARSSSLPTLPFLAALVTVGLCAVAFGGTTLIGIATSQHGVDAGWGTALCLLAAVTYAGGVVAQKPLLARSSALSITWLACCVGALCCLPFAGSMVRDLGDASA